MNKIRSAPSVLRIDHLNTSRWSQKVISPLDIQIVFYILNPIAELFYALSDALHQLGNLFPAEKQQNDQCDDDYFTCTYIPKHYESSLRTAIKADWGTWTVPI